MDEPTPGSRGGPALRAAAIYAAVSFVWIAASDMAAGALIPDAAVRQEVSIGKGFLFVAITAGLVWWLVRRSVDAARRAALAQRASERLFRELLDRVDLLAVIFDTEGRITFCNGGLLAAAGRREAEVVGRRFEDEFLPDAQARLRWRTFAGPSAGGDAAHAEVDIAGRTGERRTVRWTATLLHDVDGATVGRAAVGEDVTDRLRFEAEMRQSQKMDALGRLAGSVAHDFNNLLTAMSGYADLVLAELSPEDPAVEDVREIRRAADRASALTTQLLAFSRRRPIQAGPIDLSATVLGMEPMLRRLLGEEVELAVEAPVACWVVADPTQLEQAVLNLAVNARDAIAGGGLVRIAVAPADPALVRGRELVGGRPGPHVLLSVSDSGPGIARDVLGHLFEPFFTTKPKGKGTGLGLATVYSAVTAAGGQVWAENATPSGAVFRILVPATAMPAEGAQAVFPAVADAPLSRGRGTELVLVAEDDPDVRSLVRTVLEREGYTICEAAAGDEALRIGGEQPFDLLVTDLIMPGLGGRALVDRLRAARRNLRVLFISGYDEDPELARAGERSLDGPLLRKPFSAAELAEKVRAILDDPISA